MVTSLFLVPSVLNTLKEKSIAFVGIFFSLTNCSSILVWVHPKSTRAFTFRFLPFLVLMSACTFNSFFPPLALRFGIIYIFRGVYRFDLSYYAYSRSSPKSCSLSFLSSSSDFSSCVLRIFIFCSPLQSLAMCPFLSHLKHVRFSHSFFSNRHSFAMCSYLLQLKHLGFPSLKLSLDFPISMGCPLPP